MKYFKIPEGLLKKGILHYSKYALLNMVHSYCKDIANPCFKEEVERSIKDLNEIKKEVDKIYDLLQRFLETSKEKKKNPTRERK